ncbi:MAG: hypothetical protein JST00_38590 [Deltaproteobacteria bacterium]|nr:hypothetical protein [Deltaproteobacteria bacterium]
MSFDDLVGRWPKVCSSCESNWEESEWGRLPLVSESSLGPGVRVEMRRCRCGDVLGAAVGASRPSRG